MAYGSMSPLALRIGAPDTLTAPGGHGWTLAPVMAWGQNPRSAGPKRWLGADEDTAVDLAERPGGIMAPRIFTNVPTEAELEELSRIADYRAQQDAAAATATPAASSAPAPALPPAGRSLTRSLVIGAVALAAAGGVAYLLMGRKR